MVWRPLLWIALIRFAIPTLSTLLIPVGYTADELYYLACADHLAWGYVDHPPFSVAVLRGVHFLLGDSLLAVRLLPNLCESLALLVTAALARELGGAGRAQLLSALTMAAAPMALAIGFPYSMNPIEHLLWPLAALILARLQNGADPRLWLVLGVLLGIALLNKVSTLWLGLGLAVGLVASPARVWLGTRWPWLASAIVGAMFAPHLIWQVANDWPTLEFVRNNATGRESFDAAVVMQSPWAFVASQLLVMGPLAAPLWLAGLVHLLRSPELRAHRVLGWTFAVVFGCLALSGRGTIYYLVGVFPIVFAAGGVAVERFAVGRRARRLLAAVAIALVFQGVLVLPFSLPVVDADRYLGIARSARELLGADPEAASLPPFYPWMLGAPELTEAVGQAAASLSESERRRAGVLATTFGEAGALDHFGPAAGLPPVIGTHNSFWLWGTRGLDGGVLIVVAAPDSPILEHFERVELVGRVGCPHCEPRLRDRGIYICRRSKRPLPELWLLLKDFV
ncbi:MAG: glycosyltransferase family 39 protein [Proteobacteria bacterium]|nr:glycosyltransferase family 39 protein [Pseudomonadota bacterium]